jgi:hypothetical protein
MNVVA